MKHSYLILPLALITAPLSAQEESVEELAARYGDRGAILDISLSPSGKKIAYISSNRGHGELVNVIEFKGAQVDERQVTGNDEKNLDITDCEWITENRLVCQIWGMVEGEGGLLLPFSRTFALNEDGSDPKLISQGRSLRELSFRQDGGDIVALDVQGNEGTILFTREYIPERTIGTNLANTDSGLGVDAIDTVTGKSRRVERPDENASHYVADENGDLRLKVRALTDGRGYLTGENVYMYRDVGGRSWDRFGSVQVDGVTRNVRPVAVDAGRNVAYGFDEIDGFKAAIEIPLDSSQTAKVVMARDDVDVDQLIHIGRQRRVVGATYATEKRSIEYFDPELQALARGLSNALPEKPLVNIVGASADESQLLLIASSDTDPGMTYLYDKSSRQLEPLLPIRELLSHREMGEMTPVTYTASDGTRIPAYLTLPPGSDGKGLPAVVLPHGGPAARDEWGFDWLPQFFAARGYAVLQPNYRGSAGYGEDWYGRNGYQAWETAIGDVNDAGRWLISQGIALPNKIAIAGWSYGGYAALQSQVIDPNLFKAVVAIAPVTDLELLRDDARRYTSFELRDRQLGQGPHIAAGSPRRHAGNFKAPVALFHGDLDLNVDVRHSRLMEKALRDAGKQVRLTEFDGLQHDLGDSRARSEMLLEIDRFLNEALEQQ
ncbi:S9 family peptidase [Erythrobacter litoralis]|uniref:alpha/beta hydrolase family protein n=1 Tax=Erythrobacter litoralis TaxID=39960 RepID=UPI0024350754|nr:alpha/beta fold hydrolase [Erythrobacter litoralis]MDG6078397.1 S9 family peptidase [Erythrobacter litoralis]